MINSSSIVLESGYKYIAISFVSSLFSFIFICNTLGALLLALTIFIGYIYRNPSKHIYTNSEHILSPINGKVEAIDHTKYTTKIYCKVNLCDTHLVRAPKDGKIDISKIKHGLNLNPYSYKGTLLNEQFEINYDDMKIKFIAGVCNLTSKVTQKKEMTQGEPIAVFTEGIVVITRVKNENFQLKIGDKLAAGETKI